MNKSEYLLWDWNGTLLNDLEYNHSIINSLLCSRNHTKIDLDKYKANFCFPIRNFYKKIGFDCDSSLQYLELVNDYQETYNKNINQINLAEGAYDVLKELYLHGFTQLIFSACNIKIIQYQLQMHKIESFFDEILAPDNDFAIGKELLAIEWGERQGIDWKRVIIVGDTYYDMTVAKKLGCDCILTTAGHQHIDMTNGIYTVDSLKEILQLLSINHI